MLYVADDEAGAFVETFGHQTGTRYVAAADLASRGLARIHASRPLQLVDLTGPELTRLGADARLGSGEDYGLSQRWSRALWSQPDRPDGIYYRSRHDPSRCSLALYDRVASVLAEQPLGSFASPGLRPLLGAILDKYEYATDL